METCSIDPLSFITTWTSSKCIVAVQLVEHGDHVAEVTLGQLLRLVLIVAGVGVNPLCADLRHLVLVELPDPSGLSVDDRDATAVVLVEHRQHRPDPRGFIDHNPVMHAAGKLNFLEEVATAAREQRNRTGRPTVVLLDGLGEPLDIGTDGQHHVVIELVVLRHRPDFVQQAVYLAANDCAAVLRLARHDGI